MGVDLGLPYIRKEHKLRMYENRLLKRIFGPEREESNMRLEKIT
jgi:hypothetical protein